MQFAALIALLAAAGCSAETTPPLEVPGSGLEMARSPLEHDDDPGVPGLDMVRLIEDNTAFALDLHNRLADRDPAANFVVSPVAASLAFARAYAGARGETAAEIGRALRFTLPAERLHPAMNALSMALASRNIPPRRGEHGVKSLRILPLSSLWAERTMRFAPALLDVLSVSYDDGVRLLDFAGAPEASRQTIRGWVSRATDGAFEGLLPPGSIGPQTRLVLLDELYFYGSWLSAFSPDGIKPSVFHAPTGDIQAERIYMFNTYSWMEGDGYQVMDLPYEGGEVFFRIVFPAEGRFDEVRRQLTPEWLRQVDAALETRPLLLELPTLGSPAEPTSLLEPLRAMGIGRLFEPGADLSGLCDDRSVYLEDVVQHAHVSVDAYGSDAADPTTHTDLKGEATQTMIVDRPFFFFVRDVSRTILLSGQVTDPTH